MSGVTLEALLAASPTELPSRQFAKTPRRQVTDQHLPRLVATMLLSYDGEPVTAMQVAARLTEALDALVPCGDVTMLMREWVQVGLVQRVNVRRPKGGTRPAYFVGTKRRGFRHPEVTW